MKIAYLCDRERCGDKCSYPMCKHTFDIRHAVNFEELLMGNEDGEIVYAEKREEENEDRL